MYITNPPVKKVVLMLRSEFSTPIKYAELDVSNEEGVKLYDII